MTFEFQAAFQIQGERPPSAESEQKLTGRCMMKPFPTIVRKIINKIIPTSYNNNCQTQEPCAGRRLKVRPSDVFLVSYPRSGNTWTRFLISNLVWYEDDTDFINLEERVPDIYCQSDRFLKQLPEPRFLKSHEYFDPRYRKIIYIVRDVRSVIVSYYHFMVERGMMESTTSFYDFTRRFLDGGLDAFGSWQDNVASWIYTRKRDKKRFLLVRYEDLHRDTASALKRVASFLDLERSPKQIEKAVEGSSFRLMQNLQAKTEPVTIVRSGRVNEWAEVLDRETLELIDRRCGTVLRETGYPTLSDQNVQHHDSLIA
jgi:hypothetical protein